MMLRNTADRYGVPAKLLHWGVALLIFGLFFMGIWMHELPRNEFKGAMYDLHKSFGVLVILLVVARLAWRAGNPAPRPLATTSPGQQALALWAHRFLYLLMIAVPVVGVLMSQTGGHPVSLFGGFTLPNLMGKNELLHEGLEEMHEVLSFMLIGLVVFHAAAALWHHIVLKDDVLRRMTMGRPRRSA